MPAQVEQHVGVESQGGGGGGLEEVFNGGGGPRPLAFGLGRMQPGERWEWNRRPRSPQGAERAGPAGGDKGRGVAPADAGIRAAAAAAPPRLRGVLTPACLGFIFIFINSF